ALSPGYIVDSEPIEDDFEEDPEMDQVDSDVDEEEEEDPFEDEDEEEEEEDHLAPTDSALSVPDSVPSAEETEPFETISLRRAGKTVKPQPSLPASTKALIV
ncbi:hypothetical protein Tco_0486231, partial [Tanacetum coccineum]